TYAVGDYVWIDADKDGVQNDSEVLPGVTVELLDGEGIVVATTTTDETGYYLFDELTAGNYKVKFTLTAEQAEQYEFTTPDAGDNDAADSDADSEGYTIEFTLDET
ncbi:SdrD B-like domain-containing protein, partial [Fundicoccus sp. Sow4_H7]|uniref:SdrD B-like domain-containing protein n=1 Tax=Fundicoccus sp. Sow4_H7 TaxID=3438784 RepID=UPI003F937BE3